MESSQFTDSQQSFESLEPIDAQGATCDTFRVKLYGKLHFLKRLKPDYAHDIRYQEAFRKEFETGYRMDSESAWNDNAPVTNSYGIVKSDHITEFTGSVGVYFNLPLSSHFSLGTKALIGRSITQELDIDGHAEGNMKDIAYTMTLDNRPGHKDASGDPNISLDNLQYPNNTGEKWTDDWEYITIGAKSSTSFGTGLSLTYRYKSNFSWRVYCDYDYTRKDFTATYDPYHFVQKGMTSGAAYLTDAALMTETGEYADGIGLDAREYKTRKYMNYWTLGLSFLVNF